MASNANWLERVALLAAIAVLFTGLFYRTVYVEVEEQLCPAGEECEVSVSSATGQLRTQLIAVDVLCVLVVVLSTVYVAVMSVVPVLSAMRAKKAGASGGKG